MLVGVGRFGFKKLLKLRDVGVKVQRPGLRRPRIFGLEDIVQVSVDSVYFSPEQFLCTEALHPDRRKRRHRSLKPSRAVC